MTPTHPTETTMDCVEFQQKLPEFFETQADLSQNEHIRHCENCAALVRDLQYIAQQAKLLLPIHDPSPAVWDTIQSALKKEQNDGAEPPPDPDATP